VNTKNNLRGRVVAVDMLLVANTLHYTLHNILDAAKLWCLEGVLWPGNYISEMEGIFFEYVVRWKFWCVVQPRRAGYSP